MRSPALSPEDTSSALFIAGSTPSNATSTTGPTILLIFPLFIKYVYHYTDLAHRFNAADNLADLAGDGGLALHVVFQIELAGHVAPLVRSVLHGDHARRVLRCIGLELGVVELDRDHERHELVEHALGRRLEHILADAV